jgi:hypothetical protein
MIRYGVTNLTRPAYIAETNKKYFFPTYNQSSTLVQTDDIGLLEVDAPVPLGRKLMTNLQPPYHHRYNSYNPYAALACQASADRSSIQVTSDLTSEKRCLRNVWWW